jgi:hypothetical protein
MKRWTMAAGIAALALVAVVGTAFAAGPSAAGNGEQARERITAQVESRALQTGEAAQLQIQDQDQIRARISDPSVGGQGPMLGASLGAGAGNGPEASTTGTTGPYGTGTGECDGTGPYGRMGD